MEKPMAKWFFENKIGIDPPYIQQSMEHKLRKINQKIPEKECCSFVIRSISLPSNNVVIRGYIKNKDVIIPISPVIGKPIILFSCFDEIFLYFFHMKEEFEVYETKFSCCRNWNKTSFTAVRKGLYGEKEFIQTSNESIVLYCEITDLKPATEYHYNIVELINKEIKYLEINFLDEVCSIRRYQCVFCLIMLNSQTDFVNHINTLHNFYTCQFKDGMIHINRAPSEYTKIDVNTLAETINNDFNDRFLKNKWPIKYFKKRNSKAYSYTLNNYNSLIEKEYENINYYDSLVKHANSRALSKGEGPDYEVMREWNRLRITNSDIRIIMKQIIKKFNFILPVLRILYTLYSRGLLNSQEIMDIIDFE